MSYPPYQDFGKSTKDFFTKGFQTGSFKLSIRDTITKHMSTAITGSHTLETQKAIGDFQLKSTCPEFPGFISTTKWTTGNLITQEILAKDKVYDNTDVGVEAQYSVDTSSITGKLKGLYKHAQGTVDAVIDGGENNAQLAGSFVTGHKDFAAGYQFQYDTGEGTLKKNNISFAYARAPFNAFASLDNAEMFWLGFVYKHNPYLDLGFATTYKSDPDGYSVFTTAVKYLLDCCTCVKLKVDTNKQINLGLEYKIRPTSTITFSSQIDGDKLNAGGHKIGLSFDLEI